MDNRICVGEEKLGHSGPTLFHLLPPLHLPRCFLAAPFSAHGCHNSHLGPHSLTMAINCCHFPLEAQGRSGHLSSHSILGWDMAGATHKPLSTPDPGASTEVAILRGYLSAMSWGIRPMRRVDAQGRAGSPCLKETLNSK